jgi:hypothetical protein
MAVLGPHVGAQLLQNFRNHNFYTLYVKMMSANSIVRQLRSCGLNRKFSTSKSAEGVVSPKQKDLRFKNITLAVVLLGFVGSVYYSAISKMRSVSVFNVYVLSCSTYY